MALGEVEVAVDLHAAPARRLDLIEVDADAKAVDGRWGWWKRERHGSPAPAPVECMRETPHAALGVDRRPINRLPLLEQGLVLLVGEAPVIIRGTT